MLTGGSAGLPGRLGEGRRGFRRWRRSRPFWGGLLTVAGGWLLIAPPLAPVGLMLAAGGAATSGVLIGVILLIGGAFHWFAPQQRTFVALVCGVCSVVSFVASNLGGLGLGMLLGLFGSAMAFGWTPTARDDAEPGPFEATPARAHAVLVVVALLVPAGSAQAPRPVVDQAAAAMAPAGARPLTGRFVPQISASRLEGNAVQIRGSTTLPTADGPVEVLSLHFGTAILRDYRLATDQRDRPFSLGFDITVHDVDIYATDLRGQLALGGLRLPITLSPDLIPAELPLDVTIPTLVVDDVRAGQALILSPRATLTGLRMNAARSPG